jgi:hypothetical protein
MTRKLVLFHSTGFGVYIIELSWTIKWLGHCVAKISMEMYAKLCSGERGPKLGL